MFGVSLLAIDMAHLWTVEDGAIRKLQGIPHSCDVAGQRCSSSVWLAILAQCSRHPPFPERRHGCPHKCTEMSRLDRVMRDICYGYVAEGTWLK